MAILKRHKTGYAGVFYIISENTAYTGKAKQVYYIRFKYDGKTREEKLGRLGQIATPSDPWVKELTPGKARDVRAAKALGTLPSKAAVKAEEKAKKQAEAAKITMTKVWALFAEAKAENKSITDDRGRWKKHLEHRIGNTLVEEIDYSCIQNIAIELRSVKNQRTDTPLAAGTRHQILILIKRLLNFADANDLGVVNGKARKFKLDKLNNRKTESLSRDQEKALLKAIRLENVERPEDRMVAILMQFCWHTGFRRGELLKLRWDHIDRPKPGFIRLEDPKGGQDAFVPITNDAREVLELAKTEAHKCGVSDSPYVFPSTRSRYRNRGQGKGGPLPDISPGLRRLRDAAGLPKTWRPLHGIRHCFGTRLANDPRLSFDAVKELMTHKNPSTTERYVSSKDELMLHAVGVLNEENGFEDIQTVIAKSGMSTEELKALIAQAKTGEAQA